VSPSKRRSSARRGGAAVAERPPLPAPAPDRFLNRELSWLDFNGRVLELAEAENLPLLERVRFCSIFSSNLDEFFMVRVAGLRRQEGSGAAVRSPDGRTPQAVLAEIRGRVMEHIARESALWKKTICPALAAEGIRIAAIEDLGEKQLERLGAHFEREIYPTLTPLAVGPGQPFPWISGLSNSVGVIVRDPGSGEERFARVKVPEGMARFVPLRNDTLVPLEAVIGHFLARLFPGMEVLETDVFRVTRNADFEVSDEADDLLEAVEVELRRRRFGEVVRLEVSSSMSERMLDIIAPEIGVEPDQIYRVKGLLDLADASQLADLDRPELKFEPWSPVVPERLATTTDMLAEIRRRDLLVQLPYESFPGTVERFVRRSAKDPEVVAIKTTVYRTSDESPLVPALIEAADTGKQSVCLVELKARFDERRNIEWSRALEQAGCHVSHGFPDLKIHAKTTLVVRREAGALRRYAHIGTGNYHAVTARLYEDFGLFTDDEKITAEIAELFNYLTGFGRPGPWERLLVAPFDLRRRLIEHIRRVGDAARAGEHARMRIKVNAITDIAIIDELYAASQCGAQIDIIARSICTLRPGVEGMSERIRVRGVLGRFLEHSRVLVFESGKERHYVMGSADLMPRNLDHRIEVMIPVTDQAAQRRVDNVLDLLWADPQQAWELQPDGSWRPAEPNDGQPPTGGAQAELQRRVRGRSDGA
jgi:polyphosphate kinase